MGYSMTGSKLHVMDSDTAADFLIELGEKMVVELRKQEKVQDNEFNTDGILNVAMTLQDCFRGEEWEGGPITEYTEEFILRFEKYIAKMDKADWGTDKTNKSNHMKAYKGILNNLHKMVSFE